MKTCIALMSLLVVFGAAGCQQAASPAEGEAPQGKPLATKSRSERVEGTPEPTKPGAPAPGAPSGGAPSRVAPSGVSPGVVSPSAPAATVPKGAPMSSGAPSAMQPRNSAMPPTRPAMPNYAAGPVRAGEIKVQNFKADVNGRTVEVEGICKLTEEEATCWKPDGSENSALSTEFTNAIKSKTDSYSGQFQFRFLKKNRILVMKTTTPPINRSGGYSYSGQVMQTYQSSSDFTEGWTFGTNAFSESNTTGFDQTRIERNVLTGVFNKETKSFPVRYESSGGSYDPNAPLKTVPVKGRFEVGGNQYEVVSVSSQAPPNAMRTYYGDNRKPPKSCYVSIKVIKVTDPYLMVTLSPASESGEPYVYLNAEGKPMTSKEYSEYSRKEMEKMMEAQKAGKNYSGRSMGMQGIGGIHMEHLRTTAATTFSQNLMLDVSYVKKFAIQTQKKAIYVFEGVKLDKN